MADFKYDVAISFCSDDAAIAADFNKRFHKTFKVFHYPHQQDELAGVDAMETMRNAFREEARVDLILYQPKWGQTPWTRFEEQTIQDRCMKADGWDRLVVVILGEDGTGPKWVPSTFINYNLAEFGIEGAVGAVRARILALGGQSAPMTADRRAQIHVANQKYQADLKRFRQTSEGVTATQEELRKVFQEIDRKCKELAAQGIKIRSGHNEARCVITNDQQSLDIRWKRSGLPDIREDQVRADQYRTNIALPSEPRLIYFEGDPKPVSSTTYKLDLNEARERVWIGAHGQSGSTALADHLIVQFFELADGQDQKGRPTIMWL